MQQSLKFLSQSRWQDIVEIVSVLSAISGSIASVVTQQALFASIPLSLAVALNLANRKQILNEVKHQQSTILHITRENNETQAHISTLTQQLVEVQQQTTTLSQGTNNLQNYTQSLHNEQAKIAQIVSDLQEIENCNQDIRTNPKAENYYNRGSIYQRLGNLQAAIKDYTEAILINPSYAQAYYNRSLIHAELGDKRAALADLREATKFFFEDGNIAGYQAARDFSKKCHDLSLQTKTNNEEKLSVGCLFS
ncbi:tetratricopeptide repeat protein [Chroococcidiopsis sp. TS-821]|uniref:tetratricopeptide repeat protein n=1 Tax=Chroococcidiopsis sp. TS-821 TaxID=1378066 RepID=UPI000CEDD013|nr:tetratricopeptide repeat protein [Chroococcidiopsis sp. TS-821]PPS45909.1 hypothetical protein B1A85_06700 [Chroococcidiopsis sp. TS-821]